MKFSQVKGQVTPKLEHFRFLEQNGIRIKRTYEGAQYHDEITNDYPEFEDINY